MADGCPWPMTQSVDKSWGCRSEDYGGTLWKVPSLESVRWVKSSGCEPVVMSAMIGDAARQANATSR